MSSRARCCQVVDEMSVDDVGESPFAAAQRFEVGLALVALAPVVVLTRAGIRYRTTAAMCRALLSRRLPPRLSRCRLLSPLETKASGVTGHAWPIGSHARQHPRTEGVGGYVGTSVLAVSVQG